MKKKFMFKLFVIILAFFAFLPSVEAAKVDAVRIYSAAMKKDLSAVVVTPRNYKTGVPHPVVYLLHGYGGKGLDWVKVFPSVLEMADLYSIILVAPDARNSWYFDSPVDPEWKYETYISEELVGWVDSRYSTIKDRSGRGITGLSMGGHGALYLAIKHPAVFGSVGSMSGGVDIRPFPDNWEIAGRLGKKHEHPQNWENHSVINLIHHLKDSKPALIIDCGTSDFFFQVNEELHAKLLEMEIPHDYISREGGHDIMYWNNSLNYQLLFMHLYFTKEKGKV